MGEHHGSPTGTGSDPTWGQTPPGVRPHQGVRPRLGSDTAERRSAAAPGATAPTTPGRAEPDRFRAMRRRPMAGHPAVNRTTLVRPQPSQSRRVGRRARAGRSHGTARLAPRARRSFLGRLTAGSSALNRRMRGSNPARGARCERTRTWRPSGFQRRRRGFDSFRPCFTPRSSSRPGCRSLTPVTRVRIPLGALIDATVVSGRKHTALPAPRTGFDPRRSLSRGS